jgi:hypothetical protein
MTRWGKEAPTSSNSRRHPDLEELPPMPREFEKVFLQAADRIKDLAGQIKGSRDILTNMK